MFEDHPTAVMEQRLMPPRKARRGRGRPKSGEPTAVSAFTLKGTAEWRDWVRALADHASMPASVLIDQALKAYAKSIDFDEPMPKRQTGGDS